MRRVLVLRHVAFEDLGLLEPLLQAEGWDIDYFEVGMDSFSAHFPLDADLVVVLGGPVSVYDLDRYPFLRTEIAWLRARLIEDLPTLGICLGAQLIAAALDAEVMPGRAGQEIGWFPLAPGRDTAPAYMQALFEDDVPLWHWHGDTFAMPRGARHLAASARYPHQAFAWGRHCLALQFHPEFGPAALERWLIGHSHELAAASGTSLARLRSDTARHGSAAAQAVTRFWRGWLASLSPPAVSPTLPERARLALPVAAPV
jgi:GMP synthase (glutamine-hydrolysing)